MLKKGILCMLAMLMMLTACRTSTAPSTDTYDTSAQVESVSSQIVASNSKYELKWHEDAKMVSLESKVTGKIWSNIPYEYYLEGGRSANVNSTINITVASTASAKWDTLRGYSDAVENGRVFSKTVKNGVCITYCFDAYEISVPVIYELRDDSVLVSIDTDHIKEGTKYLLVSVSIAPFLCSARNAASDSYLFVPSGSGALMYTAETTDGERSWTGEVYGTDASRKLPAATVNEKYPVRLPVFGAKDGEHAMLGILEEGAGSAVIEAKSGNDRTGYSNVYSTFYFRGYDVFEASSAMGRLSDLTLLSSSFCNHRASVGYYPLSGSEADFNGMAKRYRQYLEDVGMLNKSAVQQTSYNISLYGARQVEDLFLGIPYKNTKALTTFAQAENIIGELGSLTGVMPTVRLLDYGEGGQNVDELAGDYRFPSILGNERERKRLEVYCQNNAIQLFTEFDLVLFGKSGNGFSYMNDSAKTSVGYVAEWYPVVSPIRYYDKTLRARFLERSKLTEAVEKLLKTADKKGISGLLLDTLGNMAYSDSSEEVYALKGKTEEDVSAAIRNAQSAGHLVSVGNANVYAAAAADVLFDVPLTHDSFNAFDEQIPFYQMIFKGYKPMYSESVNLADVTEKQIMLAAVSGVGIDFALIYNEEIEAEELYGAAYSRCKEAIQNVVSEYAKTQILTEGAQIQRYELVADGVSKTVFSNGAVVYANHTAQEVESPVGTLKAYEFRGQ